MQSCNWALEFHLKNTTRLCPRRKRTINWDEIKALLYDVRWVISECWTSRTCSEFSGSSALMIWMIWLKVGLKVGSRLQHIFIILYLYVCLFVCLFNHRGVILKCQGVYHHSHLSGGEIRLGHVIAWSDHLVEASIDHQLRVRTSPCSHKINQST